MNSKRVRFYVGIALVFLLLQGKWLSAQSCSDKSATYQAKRLYKNLYALQQQNTIFGHQDALAYGVGWKNITGKTDIKNVVGDNPGVYGWDLGHIELDSPNNIDGIPFERIRRYIKEGYARGAVITISWHLRNPLTGGSAWDTTHGTVQSVLPGGSKHELYKSWLDKLAHFMKSLKGSKGEMIPVLFRPFHELTGNWFWWCRNTTTPEEFKKLWNFTVDYLQEIKHIHHLLYVYNTASFSNMEELLAAYPGDDKVDVISFDQYQFGDPGNKNSFITSVRQQLTQLCSVAAAKNKIVAFAETGYEAIPDPQWWTETLWPAIKDFQLAYVLVWRNQGYMPSIKRMHYYAPYAGQVSALDFKEFYKYPRLLFEADVRKQKIYH